MFHRVIAQRGGKPHADFTVIKIVLGAHNQFAADHFVDVAVIRQSPQLGLGPFLLRNIGRPNHHESLGANQRNVQSGLIAANHAL